MKSNSLFLLVPFAALASCGGGGQATEDEYNDVAQAIGSTTSTGNGGGEVGSFSDSATLATGQMPPGLSASGSGHFAGTHLGLDYDYQITCSPAPCGAATDSAEVKVSWSGSLDLSNLQASIDRSGDWTLTGVQSGTATFAGEGSFSFDIAVQSLFRTANASYHLDYDATYSAVRIDVATRRPVGGSIHYQISAQHDASGPNGSASGNFDIDAVVTFAADGTATLTLDGSHHYTINLANGIVTKA